MPGEEEVGLELTRLTTQAISVINDHDFDLASTEAQEVLDHLSHSWYCRLDNFWHTLSLEHMIPIWRDAIAAEPKLRFKVMKSGFNVRLQDRVASVYMQLRADGFGKQQLRMYAFAETKWHCTDGKWICVSHESMRSGIVC